MMANDTVCRLMSGTYTLCDTYAKFITRVFNNQEIFGVVVGWGGDGKDLSYLVSKVGNIRRVYYIDTWPFDNATAIAQFMINIKVIRDRVVILNKPIYCARFDTSPNTFSFCIINLPENRVEEDEIAIVLDSVAHHLSHFGTRPQCLCMVSIPSESPALMKWGREHLTNIHEDVTTMNSAYSIVSGFYETGTEKGTDIQDPESPPVISKDDDTHVQLAEFTTINDKVGVSASVDASKRVLWICNGGIGDGVMMASAINALANVGSIPLHVDFWPMRKAAKAIGELIGKIPNVNCLDEKPVGETYFAACCDTRSSALEERAKGINCEYRINPRRWSGGPVQWARSIVDQVTEKAMEKWSPNTMSDGDWKKQLSSDIDKRRNSMKKPPLVSLLPTRFPNYVVIGTGVGGNEKNAKKMWCSDCWRKLTGVMPKETIVFVGDSSAAVPSFAKCPACGHDTLRSEQIQFSGIKEMCTKVSCTACEWSIVDLTGKTPTLMDLVPVFMNTKLYIGVDNGIGHMASGLGLPTITLFGPTNPNRYLPASHNSIGLAGENGAMPNVQVVANTVLDFLKPLNEEGNA